MARKGLVNNWGKWGAGDQLGALNYVTPEVLVKAAALVKRGKVYSLSLPIREDKVPRLSGRHPPQHYVRTSPPGYAEGSTWADDTLVLVCHGTSTHMDALCHYWKGDTMYNGFSGGAVGPFGAFRLGVHNVKGIVTRGVLLDMAAFKGVDSLPGGYAITTGDLEACCRQDGVRVERGDVALVRTGWNKTYYDRGEAGYNEAQPGLSWDAAVWLCERGICAIGMDNIGISARPGVESEDAEGRNLHELFLQSAGTYLIEMMDLEPIARDRVYEFLFMAAPLQVVGGTGSALNPLAVA